MQVNADYPSNGWMCSFWSSPLYIETGVFTWSKMKWISGVLNNTSIACTTVRWFSIYVMSNYQYLYSLLRTAQRHHLEDPLAISRTIRILKTRTEGWESKEKSAEELGQFKLILVQSMKNFFGFYSDNHNFKCAFTIVPCLVFCHWLAQRQTIKEAKNKWLLNKYQKNTRMNELMPFHKTDNLWLMCILLLPVMHLLSCYLAKHPCSSIPVTAVWKVDGRLLIFIEVALKVDLQQL